MKRQEHWLTKEEQLALLSRVIMHVTRSGSSRAAYERILTALTAGTGFEYATIERYHPEHGELEIVAHAGFRTGKTRSLRIPLAGSLSEAAVRRRKPVVQQRCDERRAELHPLLRRLRAKTCVSAPLRSHGHLIGALSIATRRDRPVDARAARFLATIGTEVARVFERRVEARKLKASEAMYRQLFNGVLDMILIIDPASGSIIDANQQATTLTGYSVRELRGRDVSTLVPSQDLPIYRKAVELVQKSGAARNLRVMHLQCKDGSTVPTEINARRVTIGGRDLMVAIARDISEHLKAETKLAASEEFLRIIVEGAQGMFFFVHDAGGTITYVSPSVLWITGHPVEEWKGHYTRFLTDDPVNETIRRLTEETLRTGVAAPPFLCEIRHASGRPIMLEVNERAIVKEGRVVGMQGVARDITERKRLEEQLIQSQKMESIGLLAGGIAHDFNNILSAILGYASYLKGAVPADDEMYPQLETIERSALRAAELTAQLLAFSRGGRYVAEPVNANTLIEETVRILRGTFDKNIEIETLLRAELPVVEADASQIQQVLMNLCVNARDAMPTGGRLTIATERLSRPDPFLRSRVKGKQGPHLKITVADTGVGIDKAIWPRIFEPFFTTKEKGKGTGLGLATVYGIVQNHGGQIAFESEVGKGTSFLVYLPAVDREAPEARRESAESAGGKETILIVDDEEYIRSLVRDVLVSKGYRVVEAPDGARAVEIYKELGNTIDLVIVDMVMPGMGGRETLASLAAMNRKIRAILSTGYAEDERAREMTRLGVKAFLQKPYRVENLIAIVRKVLDERTEKTQQKEHG